MPDSCNLIPDSWTGFSNHVAIETATPLGKSLCTRAIRCSATGKIQPDDVGFFNYMKSLMKRFHSHVIVHD
ncbi:unnamed protein product [Heligmosomoides polygyrus]|uniref:DDE_Tnp_1_7 domain-containing protein n=1 Tax=Heligmosomoides polygyrus TaxID=6339 RepID=A0A183F9L7_HELPZ|nr:unnamed protein product [Heligmosomoides polygyrus]